MFALKLKNIKKLFIWKFGNMDWDDDYHDESEFYYPEELENGPDNVNINTNEDDNTENYALENIQGCIMAQRPESTVKKTQYDMNVWRRYLDSINERQKVENIPSD
jgi:hypothetical protein